MTSPSEKHLFSKWKIKLLANILTHLSCSQLTDCVSICLFKLQLVHVNVRMWSIQECIQFLTEVKYSCCLNGGNGTHTSVRLQCRPAAFCLTAGLCADWELPVYYVYGDIKMLLICHSHYHQIEFDLASKWISIYYDEFPLKQLEVFAVIYLRKLLTL